MIADWGLGYFVQLSVDPQVPQSNFTVGGMGTEYYCSL